MKITEKYRRQSKSKLASNMKTKIKTTMIGAIASMEDHFGELWGEGKDEIDLTEEQLRMRDVFEELREEILDKGNQQIRNVDAEMNQYDIVWERYNVHFVLEPYEDR